METLRKGRRFTNASAIEEIDDERWSEANFSEEQIFNSFEPTEARVHLRPFGVNFDAKKVTPNDL